MDIQPDIVHNIAIKPIIYGTVAAYFTKISCVVNTFPGLGYLIYNKSLKDKVITSLIKKVLWILFKIKKTFIITQNKEDYCYFIENKIIPFQ